jgi:Na+/H+ antiporter NhaA
VEVGGQKYCGSCKVLPIQGQEFVPDEATIPCKESTEALTLAIVGLFCLGFIFGLIAISKAVQAKKLIAADTRLTGWGKANAAIFIGVMGFCYSVFVLFLRFSRL